MVGKDKLNTVNILGVPLYASNISSATQIILNNCNSDKRSNYCVSATGAHGLVFAKRNKEFGMVLKSFFMNLPDGMPGVWVGRMKGGNEMRRCYGPDFFASVLTHSDNLFVTHFFCGGNQGVAEELKDTVKIKFKNNNVVGTFCPPYQDVDKYDYETIAKQINQTKANIVWIGLSTPKQELFARNLALRTNVNFIITVGAAFDFHTDKVRQAPAFIQKIGMEWFFRLVMEPKRLYKRYLEIVPLFIYYNAVELIKFAVQKSYSSK